MKCKYLLAKSTENPKNPNDDETLVGHVEQVIKIAEVLIDMLSLPLQNQLGCSVDTINIWGKAVWIAAWLHDCGKANDHFQYMIRNTEFRQGIRHETLSLAILNELNNWLLPLWDTLPKWAKASIFFSISGHHLKFPDPLDDRVCTHNEYVSPTKAIIYLAHSDFKRLLDIGKNKLSLSVVPDLENITYDFHIRGNLKKCLLSIQHELDDDFSDLEKTLIANVKSALMTADLAGSALPKKISKPVEWLEDRLGKVLTKEQLQKVVETRLNGKSPHTFQLQVRNTDCNTILAEAGCGSGKTAAAYLWASRYADKKRLFFCYPTTATASEGFAGYLHEPDFDTILIHSRAKIDYHLLKNMPKPNKEEMELRRIQLEALETWPIPAVVCTAHTVIGIMENVRRGLYTWPSLVRSVFIFDEIHAFSDRLFPYLLRFLLAFPNTPVLLMTATLPPSRKTALEEVCKKRNGLKIIKGPDGKENALRYQIQKSNYNDALEKTREILNDSGKVLWVCNTVNRCFKIMEEAEKLKLPVQLFHSRYRYKDRLKRQRAVIDGFKSGNPAMLAVTTQVAEMSLDLSADLLISEWAPIPAMIQRLGRVNRFEEIPVHTKPALFIEPENLMPYYETPEEETELRNSITNWLDIICQKNYLSQRDLAETFVKIEGEKKVKFSPASRCEWLDGLWESLKNKRSIEEAGYTIDIVREEDLKTGLLEENAIPMPFPPGEDWKKWNQERFYLVAPKGSINYNELRGAIWNRSL